MLLLSLQASDKEKRELWPFMRQSVQNQDQVSTSPLPPPLFDRRAYPGEGGGWDLNLTWLEWEIWTGNVKSFQRNTSVIYFNMEAFRHLNTNFGPGEKIEHTNLQIETLKLKFRSPLLP